MVRHGLLTKMLCVKLEKQGDKRGGVHCQMVVIAFRNLLQQALTSSELCSLVSLRTQCVVQIGSRQTDKSGLCVVFGFISFSNCWK